MATWWIRRTGDHAGDRGTPTQTNEPAEPGFEGAYDMSEPTARYDSSRPQMDLPPEEMPAQGSTVDVAEAAPAEQRPPIARTT